MTCYEKKNGGFVGQTRTDKDSDADDEHNVGFRKEGYQL